MSKLDVLARLARGPWFAAATPALCLAAYVGFGRFGLLAVAIVLPLAILACVGRVSFLERRNPTLDPATGLPFRLGAVLRLEEEISQDTNSRRSVAALAVGIEDFQTLTERHGDLVTQKILQDAAERLKISTRQWDAVVRLEGPRFAIALTRLRRADLEVMIEIAARVQRALSEPYVMDGAKLFLATSVGICLPPIAPNENGEGIVTGAERALEDAMRLGGGAIRRYSEDMRRRDVTRIALQRDAIEALKDGRIRPWFQPQISTDTGEVTGMEALARWEEPDIGLISPAEFLPALEAEGLLDRLGEVMLAASLDALKAWDKAGLKVPSVGVNVSEPELRNPKFCDQVRWELDRLDVAAERLTIEVLESVTSNSSDDVVSRNLSALSKLGCKIDLDDFGTGNASLSSIRRFGVHRLKIDRSYISEVDTDSDQQAMVAAIVTMAEQLQLETLAEGVETLGEHAMAAQLGCLYVQGFVVSRPMPVAACTDWLFEQKSKRLSAVPPDIAAGLATPRTPKAGKGKSA